MTPAQLQRLIAMQKELLKRRVKARTESKLKTSSSTSAANKSIPIKMIIQQINTGVSPTQAVKNVLAISKTDTTDITPTAASIQQTQPIKDILGQIKTGVPPTQAIKNILTVSKNKPEIVSESSTDIFSEPLFKTVSKNISEPSTIVQTERTDIAPATASIQQTQPIKDILGQIKTGIPPTQAIKNVLTISKEKTPPVSTAGPIKLKNINWVKRDIGDIWKVADFQYEVFKQGYPAVDIPTGPYGEYDVVKITTVTAPGTNRIIDKRYEFSYSPAARHKIEVAGSIDRYNSYEDYVLKHQVELTAAYAFSGGEGIGPLGLIPTMGVDLALDSPEKRKDKLISRLAGVEPGAMGFVKELIKNPIVVIVGTEAVAAAAAPILRATTKGVQKAVPYVIKKLPTSQKLIQNIAEKVINSTAAINKFGAKGLGGASEYSITKTEIIQNFLKWANEGYVPVTRTTAQVVDKPLINKVMDYIKQIPQKDFEKYIKFKPQTWYGFAEREFITPERASYYLNLLKQGPIKEATLIARGEYHDPYAWMQVQGIVDETLYRRGLRNVLKSYKSTEFDKYWSRYPKTVEGPTLTESQAAMKAILEGRKPGMTYGSLYNVQKLKPDVGGISQRFLTPSDDITFIATKQGKIKPAMENIWAKEKFNLFKKESATGGLLRQPRVLSAEEKSIISRMKYIGDTSGKGLSRQAMQQFMIPATGTGLKNLGALFLFNQFQYKKSVENFNKQIQRQQREVIKRQQDYIAELHNRYNQFLIPSKESRKITEYDFFTLMNPQRQDQRMIQYWRQMQKQNQDEIQKVIKIQKQYQKQIQSERTWESPPPDRTITIFDVFGPGRPRKGRMRTGVILTPPIPPFYFPGMGGKIASKGKIDPFWLIYYNELEATRKLMREVLI